jgi:uncharacterized membrane protein
VEEFFGAQGKARFASVISRASVKTRAEIVVALRRRATPYPEVAFLGGGALALLYLAVFLYYPEPFAYALLPVELLGMFAIGALLATSSSRLHRLLTAAKRRSRAVQQAASLAFLELGISTRGKVPGVLVFVAGLEQTVELATDAVTRKRLGPQLEAVAKKLDRSVRLDQDLQRFEQALLELVATLGEHFPNDAEAEAGADNNEDPS